MEDTTWLKLYRKLSNHDILFDDKALRLFIWLLLHVDKRTGSLTTGRFLLAESLRMHPSTIYKVLKRLEKKYKIVTALVTTKNTTIRLVNWEKYNLYDEKVTTSVTTKEQQSNNKVTHNKTYRHKDISTNVDMEETPKDREKNAFVETILSEFETRRGHIPSDKFPRRVAWNVHQLITSFVSRNAETYLILNGRQLTDSYTLGKAWDWLEKKNYEVEKLETFKLKMRVYLDSIEKQLAKEVSEYEEGN